MGSTAAHGLSLATALRLGRVSNLPTVWTNVLAGVVLSGVSFSPGRIAALMAALSLFYVSGMYFNDAFDAEYDRAHVSRRPIPAGDVALATVFGVAVGLMLAGLALLAAIGLTAGGTGLRSVAVGLALAAAILVYDLWHKGNPIGPVLMGLCRALVYVTAAASVAIGWSDALLPACLLALSYLVGLTYLAKQEHLTKPGRFWPLLFLFAPFVWLAPAVIGSLAGCFLLAALGIVVIRALWIMIRSGRHHDGRAVGLLIAGICLLDGLFVASQGRPALAASTVLAFGLTLLAQRWVSGT